MLPAAICPVTTRLSGFGSVIWSDVDPFASTVVTWSATVYCAVIGRQFTRFPLSVLPIIVPWRYAGW